MRGLTLSLLAAIALPSCAFLHHVQISDIDNRSGYTLQPIDIKLSETGFNIDEAADIARGITRSERAREDIDTIRDLIKMFQMGPKTGNPVFNDRYARNTVFRIYEACPNGNITGITSIRETRKYPVISGEIVRITGYCKIPRR